MKRYQECNFFVKLWRCRWYIVLPFIFIFRYLKGIRIYEDKEVDGKLIHTTNYFIANFELTWSICKGSLEVDKMNFYYTMDEVMEMFKRIKFE